MKMYLSLLFVMFLTINLSAQDNVKAQNIVKVGDKAPKINITDYILNAPKDKKLDKKFIVLEFWATWCAPCLGAVPHLNELQNTFKNRKDLVFLSLTYEKPEKIKRTLEKISFKTVVVSDQTKETEKSYNVESIPRTVLIDNNGIVKFIGHPKDLNNALMENFLAGKSTLSEIKETTISEVKTENKDEVKTEDKKAFNMMEIPMGFLEDKNTQYIFTLTKVEKRNGAASMGNIVAGEYFDLNNSLTPMLSKIIKKSENQIIIPEKLLENKYDIIYKNVNKADASVHAKNLKDNLLNALNLTESIETKKIDVYNLKVVNAKKLNISTEEKGSNHWGGSDTHLVFSNVYIEQVIGALEKQHKIIIFNETGLKDGLDFLIKKGKLDELMADLAEYGLALEKVTKEIEFYNYK